MRRCLCLLVAILGLCAARPGLGQFRDSGPSDSGARAGQAYTSPLPPVSPANAVHKPGLATSESAAGAAEGTPRAPGASQSAVRQPQPVEPPVAADDQGKVRCQRGMVIRAVGGSFRAIVGTMAVPDILPGEQQVRVVAEDVPARGQRAPTDPRRRDAAECPSPCRRWPRGSRFGWPLLSRWPYCRRRRCRPTWPSTRRPIRPGWTAGWPPSCAPSPLIESNRPEVTRLAAEIAGDKQTALEKIKAIHAWVYENIKFEMPAELGRQSVLQTIKKRTGVCAEKNSLAVALLRAAKIPARLVRVASSTSYEHCYYEFCLLDGEGHPAWIAGDASATPRLEPRIGSRGAVILQKGDNLLVQAPKSNRQVRQRFLETTLSGLPNSPGAN